MSRRLLFAVLIGVLTALSTEAVGAQTANVRYGSRVRITAPTAGLEARAGTVRDTTVAALLVEFDGDSVAQTVQRNNITQLEVATRTRGHAVDGMLVGLLAGIGFGAIHGAIDPRAYDIFSSGASRLGATVFGGLGLVVGGIIGDLIRTDVWPSGDATVSIRPARESAGPSLQIGFAVASP